MKKSSLGTKIVIGFLGLLLGTYLVRTVSDPDLWWHIVIGRWILSHQSVPWLDYWNASGVDKPWRAYSWSMEVVFALLDRFGGITGLQIAQSLYGLIFSFLILGVFVSLAQSPVIGSMIGALVVAAVYPYFFLRPQTISWILLALLILVGERIRVGGVSRRRLLAVWALMFVWANTNITSIIGLGLICAWVLDLDSREKLMKSLKVSLQIAGVGFLGTLFTPYYGSEWLMASQTFYHPWLYSNISEFMALTLYNFQVGILLLEIVLLGFLLHYQPRGVPPSVLVVLVGCAGLGVCVSKFCPLAVIVASAVLAVSWAKYSGNPMALGNIGVGVGMLEDRLSQLSKKEACIASGVLMLGCLTNVARGYNDGNYAYSYTPVRALDFVLAQNLPLPVLSTFGSGGYVMYRFSDKSGIPVFRVAIDGRTNVNDPDIVNSHTAAINGQREWQGLIEKTQSETIVWPNESSFVSLLIESDEWCSVFDEAEFSVLDPKLRYRKKEDKSYGQSVFVRRSYFEAHQDVLTSADCSRIIK